MNNGLPDQLIVCCIICSVVFSAFIYMTLRRHIEHSSACCRGWMQASLTSTPSHIKVLKRHYSLHQRADTRYKSDRSIPSRNFHGDMLHHCLTNYASKTKWLFHIDVDEYIRFSSLYKYGGQPHAHESTAAARWQYPLHDYLLSPRSRLARCMTLSREGNFVNVGVLASQPRAGVIDRILHRESRHGKSHAGKVRY